MRRMMIVLLALSVFVVSCGPSGVDRWKYGKYVDHRYEVEAVPDARLVRVDTTPRWELGRYAFLPGNNVLAVITRITAVPITENTDPDAPARPYPLEDYFMQRVWITIPADANVGDRIYLSQLEENYLTGYDDGLVTDDFFIQPNRVLGYLDLLERSDEGVTVAINLRVEPLNQSPWTFDRDNLTLAHTPEGIRAAKAPQNAVLLGRRLGEREQVNRAVYAPAAPVESDDTGDGAADEQVKLESASE